MREVFGEDALARWQRFMALSKNPRPRADTERAVLWQAVAPLMAGLAASGMSRRDVREEAHEEREAPSMASRTGDLAGRRTSGTGRLTAYL